VTGAEFEAEVLRIARAIWPQAADSGPTIVQGRERDGIFITDDQIALIEATADRTKLKAEKDGKKLDALARDFGRRFPMHAVKAWFVTLHEPTADQRDAIKRLKNPAVMAVSFSQFRSRLIDASAYLEARLDHAFGSARALDEGGSYKEPGAYVGLDILEGTTDTAWSVTDIAKALLAHQRIILLGDFGAGKSMTIREVFFSLRERYRRSETSKFPVHLNLGEHLGQTDASEAFMRHGQKVGFAAPYQLVRAWRSGYAMLLLDGFDEMAATNWSGDAGQVKEARRRAVQLVRQIFAESPADVGILVAGREYYFDNEEERRESLGYAAKTSQLSLNDFSDAQLKEFLHRQEIPTWLPRRPYLLGYLAARNLLPEADAQTAPAAGWTRLLDGIAEREARPQDGIAGGSVRQILERLGSYARDTTDGLGPLTFDQISRAFRDVVGRSPDVSDYVLLQRLPGLGVADAVTGARRFIDSALADAIAAGDPLRFALDPYSADPGLDASSWHKAIGALGAEVLAARIDEASMPDAARRTAVERAIERGWHTLAFDLVRAIDTLGGELSGAQIPIEGIWVDELSLGYSGATLGSLRLADSVIQTFDVNAPLHASETPLFIRCTFGHVVGVAGPGDLPPGRFEECDFGSFSETTNTTQAILRMSLPLPLRVGLTILRKLYLQRGAGRRDGALRRGLDESGKAWVDPVLKVFQTEGLTVPASVGRQRVWLPVRGQRSRVLQVLSAPMTCEDSAMVALRTLD
jgi:hypothetical protein